MSADVRLVKVLTPALVVLTHNGDQAIWSKVTTRKATTCAVTGRLLPPGSEAFRPIGNQKYRMERIAAAVITAATDLQPMPAAGARVQRGMKDGARASLRTTPTTRQDRG